MFYGSNRLDRSRLRFTMRTRDLDLENLVGQGYDSAGAMSGAFNGACTCCCLFGVTTGHALMSIAPCNHVLNLCLSHGSSEQAVRNAMRVLSSAANFYGHSSKRTTLMETIVTKQMTDSEKKTPSSALRNPLGETI